MKFKAKLAGATAETENCFQLGKDLIRMECGFALTYVLLKPDRIKATKGIAYEDLAMGLGTIRGGAWKLRWHFRNPDNQARASRIEKSIDGVLARLKKKGRDLTAKEAERIRRTVDRLGRQRDELEYAARDRCQLKTSYVERMERRQREKKKQRKRRGKR